MIHGRGFILRQEVKPKLNKIMKKKTIFIVIRIILAGILVGFIYVQAGAATSILAVLLYAYTEARSIFNSLLLKKIHEMQDELDGINSKLN